MGGAVLKRGGKVRDVLNEELSLSTCGAVEVHLPFQGASAEFL